MFSPFQWEVLRIFIIDQCVKTWESVSLTWVEDGAGAAPCGPGLGVKRDPTPLYLHLGVLTEHLLNFDLHLSVGALIVGRQHFHF